MIYKRSQSCNSKKKRHSSLLQGLQNVTKIQPVSSGQDIGSHIPIIWTDYCPVLLSSPSANTTVRTLTETGNFGHITPILASLYWFSMWIKGWASLCYLNKQTSKHCHIVPCGSVPLNPEILTEDKIIRLILKTRDFWKFCKWQQTTVIFDFVLNWRKYLSM